MIFPLVLYLVSKVSFLGTHNVTPNCFIYVFGDFRYLGLKDCGQLDENDDFFEFSDGFWVQINGIGKVQN